MNKKSFIIFSVFIIFFTIFFSVYNYENLPETIASHWDEQGNPNGYSSKLNGLIILPIIIIFIFLMGIFIPIISPNKESILKFKKEYYNFMAIILIFLFFTQIYTIYVNLGYNLSIIKLFSFMFFIIFYYSAILISKAKQNYFIGIRTPWTLKNKKVWNKTHKIGSVLFKISSLICLIGLFYENLFIWVILIPIISSSIFLYIYSYIIYNKIKKD